jgi:hypothetical protein
MRGLIHRMRRVDLWLAGFLRFADYLVRHDMAPFVDPFAKLLASA